MQCNWPPDGSYMMTTNHVKILFGVLLVLNVQSKQGIKYIRGKVKPEKMIPEIILLRPITARAVSVASTDC